MQETDQRWISAWVSHGFQFQLMFPTAGLPISFCVLEAENIAKALAARPENCDK